MSIPTKNWPLPKTKVCCAPARAELDCQHAALAKAAMAQAECVVALTAFKSKALDNADGCTRGFVHSYLQLQQKATG